MRRIEQPGALSQVEHPCIHGRTARNMGNDAYKDSEANQAALRASIELARSLTEQSEKLVVQLREGSVDLSDPVRDRDDAAYYRARAEEARLRAAEASDERVAAIHLKLALRYERRALADTILFEYIAE
jgi:hypothetical protein